MARFDVYRNPGASASSTPFLLDVQSNLLDDLSTRVVIPLRRLEPFAEVRLSDRFTPRFHIEGQDCLLDTAQIGAVPRRVLKPPVASLLDAQDRITAALDFLFQGY